MVDDPENLLLVYFRRLDGKLDQVIKTQRDHDRRLTTLEISLGNLAATEMSHHANLSLRVDQMEARLDRTERRPDLRVG